MMRSLNTRLMATFAGIVVLATVVSGGPAYWIIRSELERQVVARLGDSRLTTNTHLEAALNDVAGVAHLAAERPTLRALLQSAHLASKPDYLETLRAGSGVDVIAVEDPAGSWSIAGELDPSGWIDSLATSPSFVLITNPPARLVVAAAQEIVDPSTGNLLGRVVAVTLMGDAFATQLAGQTGVGQSFVVGGVRIASSIVGVSGTKVDKLPAEDEPATSAENGELTSGGEHFRTGLVPIRGAQNDILGYAEVALPIDATALAERQAVLTLVVSTIAIALAGSVVGAVLARRIAGPIETLTESADQLSRGNLDEPVPIVPGPPEIVTLATALEAGRLHLRRSLAELSASNKWSENLIESIVEGVLTIDADGTVDFFSRGAERLTGWQREEAMGLPLDLVLRPVQPASLGWLENLPEGGAKRQVKVFNQAGREVALAITAARLKPTSGNETQTALVLRDVTEEEAVRGLRSYFLANISHEFKTPLAALSASIELLLDEAKKASSEDVSALLKSVHVSSLGLQTLVDNLLESTSIEAGRFTVRSRPTRLDQVLDDALHFVEPLMERRNQELRVVNGPLRSVVEADPTRLTQVLVNLLSNASKYSPMGEAIEIRERSEGGELRLEVADRGPGIALTERPTMFRRFVRLQTEDGSQYGIGLGLSVVKAIVEGHGGKVGVEGREGGGSVFWFTLPLTQDGS
jgi:two-component system phosphate regulon sensor histidine kinase PhoR